MERKSKKGEKKEKNELRKSSRNKVKRTGKKIKIQV